MKIGAMEIGTGIMLDGSGGIRQCAFYNVGPPRIRCSNTPSYFYRYDPTYHMTLFGLCEEHAINSNDEFTQELTLEEFLVFEVMGS